MLLILFLISKLDFMLSLTQKRGKGTDKFLSVKVFTFYFIRQQQNKRCNKRKCSRFIFQNDAEHNGDASNNRLQEERRQVHR